MCVLENLSLSKIAVAGPETLSCCDNRTGQNVCLGTSGSLSEQGRLVLPVNGVSSDTITGPFVTDIFILPSSTPASTAPKESCPMLTVSPHPKPPRTVDSKHCELSRLYCSPFLRHDAVPPTLLHTPTSVPPPPCQLQQLPLFCAADNDGVYSCS